MSLSPVAIRGIVILKSVCMLARAAVPPPFAVGARWSNEMEVAKTKTKLQITRSGQIKSADDRQLQARAKKSTGHCGKEAQPVDASHHEHPAASKLNYKVPENSTHWLPHLYRLVGTHLHVCW